MIKITTQPIYDEFLQMCADARQNIMLCAPFVKREIVDDIFSATDRRLSMQLITNINLQSFHRRASDLGAIEKFISNGLVYNCTTLHAKLYIFDNKKCLITSANLTTSGLRKNLECSMLTDNLDLVDSSVYEYNSIIKDNRVGRITLQSISDIGKILEKIPPVQKIAYPQFDLSATYESDINSIAKSLAGWRKSVFIILNSMQEDTFSSQEVKFIAEQLKEAYPENHNREAKVRQILQQLRDTGLIEFTSPGIYRRLWVKGAINEV
ncbi:MAG TPA: phospholipase D-like domain-containing protein [Bacillota bacterium]|nr:phospholipase D-like domain-containing protein [Bacillota bacterium]